MTAKCDNCNERIPLPPSLAGQTVACPHCHKPTKLLALSTKCPSCLSPDTIQCSVAWQSGTSKSKISGLGMDLTGDIGGFVGTQTSQTLLAASMAPPPMPVPVNGGAWAGLMSVGAFGIVLGLVGLFTLDYDANQKWVWLTICPVVLVGGIAAMTLGSHYAQKEKKRIAIQYSAMMDIYMRQWVCRRCGSKFEV